MRTLTGSYSLEEIMDVLECYHKKRGKTHSPDSSIPKTHWQGKGWNLIKTKVGGGSSLPAWGVVAFVQPGAIYMAAGQDPKRAGESPCIFQFSPAFPRGVTATHTHYHSPGVCRALVVSSLQEAASRPKGSAELNAELKAHPVGIVLSVAIPFSHSSTVGWEHHWQLFSNLSVLLSFPSFFHCVIQRHVVFPSVQVNFSFFFFFPLFLEVLIPKS